MIIPDVNKSKTKRQWIATMQVSLMMFLVGSNYGWMSPFMGKMNRPDPPFQATHEQKSWVASIAILSRMISIVGGSIAANYFGSKTSLHTSGFFYVVSWICLICANSINLVLINQFFCGLAIGTIYTIFPLYLGEILSANIRGTLISFVMNLTMIGVLYGNLIGSHIEPWIFGTINLVLSGIFFITFYFLPSTPQYLINCNKVEEAENALRYYNNSAEVSEEFSKLVEFIKSSPRVSFLGSLRRLKDPINLKTFIMINIVYSIVQLSGTYSILEYLEVTFMASRIEIILPSTLVTIMSVVALPASWVAVAIGDKFGRVTFLLASCIIFCVAFAGWGLGFHLLELGFNPTDIQWLVIFVALVYRLNMCIGLNPIVPVLMSEVFAPNVKSISACLCNVISTVFVFISVKNFQLMAESMTYKYLFYFYAGLVLAIGVYTKVCIPETKGKTLQEIQEMFLKNYNKSTKKVPSQVYVNTVCEQTKIGDVNITKL